MLLPSLLVDTEDKTAALLKRLRDYQAFWGLLATIIVTFIGVLLEAVGSTVVVVTGVALVIAVFVIGFILIGYMYAPAGLYIITWFYIIRLISANIVADINKRSNEATWILIAALCFIPTIYLNSWL